MVRPFRFGVNVWTAASRAAWQDKARRLEALGYAVLAMPDHIGPFLSPMPALLSAAEATRSLRVGTNVLNNDFRHPVLLAREAATLDLLTDGRLELGLGAGYQEAEYRTVGLPFHCGGTRVGRLAETVAVLKGLFSGAPTAHDGAHYRVAEHTLHPLPAQRPRPPLLVGGNGRRLLSLAAREADIVGLSGITFRAGGTVPDLSGFRPSAVDERLTWVRAAAGARFPTLELNALVQRVIVTPDRQAAAAALQQESWDLSPEDLLATPFLLIGTVEQIADDLWARRERWGLSYFTIFESAVEALAPVVARLANT